MMQPQDTRPWREEVAVWRSDGAHTVLVKDCRGKTIATVHGRPGYDTRTIAEAFALTPDLVDTLNDLLGWVYTSTNPGMLPHTYYEGMALICRVQGRDEEAAEYEAAAARREARDAIRARAEGEGR